MVLGYLRRSKLSTIEILPSQVHITQKSCSRGELIWEIDRPSAVRSTLLKFCKFVIPLPLSRTIDLLSGGSTPVTTVAGGWRADSSASSEVAMVCCLGSRSRARLMPKEDCRNQGMEIFLRVLVPPPAPPPFFFSEAEEDGEGVAPARLGLAAAAAAADAAGKSEEDMVFFALFTSGQGGALAL